ncbi:hypothetical protein U1Q18_010881 [Sarracenia purpurea var. burkii]
MKQSWKTSRNSAGGHRSGSRGDDEPLIGWSPRHGGKFHGKNHIVVNQAILDCRPHRASWTRSRDEKSMELRESKPNRMKSK